jgi:hypothetical protein
VPPLPTIATFVSPAGAAKVPGVLNVSLPAGMPPPPKTPIFEVPIAIIQLHSSNISFFVD